MSRLLVALVALVLALAVPGAVLAAAVDVGGTVRGPDGTGASGVEVLVLVQGTDQVVATTSDADGGWGVQVDAEAGSGLEISATGPTLRSAPDDQGCVTLTTPTARLTVTIEQVPPAPVDLVLDGVITGQVCGATATPRPAVTPPSTDGPGAGAASRSPDASLMVLLLAGLSSVALTATRRRAVQRGGR
jgi:hypothetical protein